jgi:hypothetical protein
MAVGTADYRIWKGILESKGIKVVETDLRPGLRGYFESATELRVDPNQFRVLDILHETRHYKQIQRAKAAGAEIDFAKLNTRQLGIAEYDAYRYEIELGRTFGFSEEYMSYLHQRIYDYWGKPQKEVMRSFSKGGERAKEFELLFGRPFDPKRDVIGRPGEPLPR